MNLLPLLLLPLSIPLCALARRWAGGLLSQWIHYDLGDILVRWLDGAITGLVLAASLYLAGQLTWITALYCAAVGIGQFLCLSFGNFNSLNAGFTPQLDGSFKFSVKRAFHDWPGLCLVGLLFNLPLIVFSGLWGWLDFHTLWGLLAIILSPWWCFSYVLAWLKPWNMPALGAFKNDPPPTGELISGAGVGLIATLMGLLPLFS